MGESPHDGTGAVRLAAGSGFPRTGSEGRRVARGTALRIALVLIPAASFRLAYISTVPVIESEGAEYARIAENVRTRRAYEGLQGRPELRFPPIYPLAIAAVSAIAQDVAVSGRVVSLIAGLCAVALASAAARAWFGRRAAALAAGLVAGMPFLIWASAKVFSEMTYASFALLGVLCLWRGKESGRMAPHAIAGAAFGLAHLARTEAAPYGFLLLALAWLLSRRPIARRWAGAIAFAAAFAVAVLPYAVFLRAHTGRWAIEGKSHLNAIFADRMARGMSFREAAFGLDGEGRPAGPFLELAAPPSAPSVARVVVEHSGALLRRVRWNLEEAAGILLESLGLPSLVLAAIGFLPRPGRTEWRRGTFLAAAIALPIGFVAPLHLYPRYLVPAALFLGILAARGIERVAEGMVRIVPAAAGGVRTASAIVLIAIAIAPACPILLRTSPRFAYDARTEPKEIGLWIRAAVGPGRIVMSGDTRVPFYAGGIWVPLPVGRPEHVISYAQETKVDLLVAPPSSELGLLLSSEGLDARSPLGWRRLHVVQADPSPLAIFGRTSAPPRSP